MRKFLAALLLASLFISLPAAQAASAWSSDGATIVFSGSATVGGSLLALGSCSSTTATVTGAVVGMYVGVTPASYPGDGTLWFGYVSAANTVTVKVCALVSITPPSTTYYIRVMQ